MSPEQVNLIHVAREARTRALADRENVLRARAGLQSRTNALLKVIPATHEAVGKALVGYYLELDTDKAVEPVAPEVFAELNQVETEQRDLEVARTVINAKLDTASRNAALNDANLLNLLAHELDGIAELRKIRRDELLAKVSELEHSGFTVDLNSGVSEQLSKLSKEMSIRVAELARAVTMTPPPYTWMPDTVEFFESRIKQYLGDQDEPTN